MAHETWTIEEHAEGWEVYNLNRIVQHSLESEDEAMAVIRRRKGFPATVTVVEADGHRRQVKVAR